MWFLWLGLGIGVGVWFTFHYFVNPLREYIKLLEFEGREKEFDSLPIEPIQTNNPIYTVMNGSERIH